MRQDKIKQIDSIVEEARRFIEAADKWRWRILKDKLAYLSGSKEGGAAKRASMDLSRSLTEFRRS